MHLAGQLATHDAELARALEPERRHLSVRVVAQLVRLVYLNTTRYDTRCYFNVRSKADTSRLNLPHGNDN